MNPIAITIPNAEALPPSMLSNIREGFQSAFEQAEAWREKALAAKRAAAAPDKTKLRTIACVNACAGMADPAKEIERFKRCSDKHDDILSVIPADAPCQHAETGETVADYILGLQKEVATLREEREARAKLEAELAAKRAAAAPDKTKLRTIADSVRAIPFPAVTTPEANVILADIAAKRESFAKWIEAQTEKL